MKMAIRRCLSLFAGQYFLLSLWAYILLYLILPERVLPVATNYLGASLIPCPRARGNAV